MNRLNVIRPSLMRDEGSAASALSPSEPNHAEEREENSVKSCDHDGDGLIVKADEEKKKSRKLRERKKDSTTREKKKSAAREKNKEKEKRKKR